MKKYNTLLYLLAFIKLVLPFFLQSSVYDPQRDELLYLAEGQHMAWGFMEIPPFLSVFAWLTHLLGDSVFWLKFWPSLFGALTYILTGKLILHIGGKYFALFMAFLVFIFSGYLRMHFLFQPNFLEIFFWTLIAYGIIRFIETEKKFWLYVTGVSAGLGMMSKYSVLFFIVSVLLGLLLTPQRKILANKHFYIAAAIGFVIFLPNVIWQYSYNFAVLHHMQELQRTQLQYVNPLNFIIDQFLMFLPCVVVWPAGLVFAAFNKQGKNYRFMAWAWVFVIILLLLLQGKSYYAMGIYPILAAFGAYRLEYVTAKRMYWRRYILVVVPLLFTPVFVPVLLPVFAPAKLAEYLKATHAENTGALRWEDQQNHPLPQDFADMLGWQEMGQKVAGAYNTLTPAEKQNTIIFCDNYGQAGAVSFYAKKYGTPLPYSTNASFLYWMPDTVHITNMVLLTDDPDDMHKPFIKHVAQAILYDSIITPYAREYGDQVIILKGVDGDFNKMFAEKIAKARAPFVRH